MEPDISISIVLYAQTDKKKYMYIIMPHTNTEVATNIFWLICARIALTHHVTVDMKSSCGLILITLNENWNQNEKKSLHVNMATVTCIQPGSEEAH